MARPVPVGATFSQPLDPATVSRAAVRVFSAQRGGHLSGTYSGGGTASVAFAPAQFFRAGEIISTTFTTALRSASGTALAAPFITQFTTDAAPSTGTFTGGGADFAGDVSPAAVTAADVDGDGVLDLISAGRGGTVDWAFGDGTGQFVGQGGLGVGGSYGSIIAADINGDGALDLLAPRVRAGTVALFKNSGTGRTGLALSTDISVDNDARQIAATDIDGDGDLDLLVTCYSGTVAIRFNNGLGVFSAATSVPLNTAYGIAAGDVDNDGDVDFLATDYANGLVTVRLNNGRGVFAAGATITVGTSPAGVALGDVDGDGDLDALVANLGSNSVSVAKNTGTGTFLAPVSVTAPNPAQIALGDVDGDGDLDFVSTDYLYGGIGVAVRLNNGQGVFSAGSNVTVEGDPTGISLRYNYKPFGVALADMDGNGTLDVMAATFGGYVSVRLNPYAPAVLTSSVAAVCAGTNAGTLTLTRRYGTVVKYQADSGTGFQDVPGANTGATLPFANLTTTTTYRAVLLTPEGRTIFSAPATVTVNPLPVAAITPNGPTVFCQGGSVRLTASGGASYRWSTGATTASITAATGGTYGVTVTSAAGCVSAATATVTVNPATTASFAYSSAAFCADGPNPVPAVTGTSGGAFASTPGLTLDATTGTIDVAASVPGAYAVTYRVGGPCPSTATASVSIVSAPVALFGYPTATGGAGGTTTVAPALGPGASAGTFSSGPGLSLNAATGVITLSTSLAGTYAVTNTVAGAGPCGARSATAAFTVTPRPSMPTITATYNGTTTTLTSSAATGNQWYLNGVLIPGATSQTYVVNGAPAQLGAYTVTVTDANGGTSFFSAPLVLTSSGKPLAGTSLRVYPNPTSDGRLWVELTGYRATAALTVVNALGQVVFAAQVPVEGNTTTRPLNLSQLAAGVYLLRVQSEGGIDIRRVVRE